MYNVLSDTPSHKIGGIAVLHHEVKMLYLTLHEQVA